MASPLSKLFANAAVAVDHKFGWDKLPKPLGIVTLIGLRTKLREQNLYDTGRGETVDPAPDDGHHLTARTTDGTYNDLSSPTMGAIGARFGRNVPLAKTFREPDDSILEPNPRTISRELLTRDEFKPASIVNLLAGAWLQFEVHDWFSHGKNEDASPWLVELEPNDDWYERPMRIPRTRVDPSHVDDGSPSTYVTADSHWWDAPRSTAATRASRSTSGRTRTASCASTPMGSCRATWKRSSTSPAWPGTSGSASASCTRCSRTSTTRSATGCGRRTRPGPTTGSSTLRGS